jgi:hypothetical protein
MTIKRRASEPEAVTYRQSLATQDESLFFLHEANHSACFNKKSTVDQIAANIKAQDAHV